MIFDEQKILIEISTLKSKREELNNILEDLKKNNNNLKEHWESKTSESVFLNFENSFYNEFQKHITDLDEDIKFLEETVENYKKNEDQTNKEIDEKIIVE